MLAFIANVLQTTERMKAVRTNLKVLRVSRRMNQAELAELIGVSRATYSNVERGKRNGSIEFWSTLKNTFDIADSDMWRLMRKDGDDE